MMTMHELISALPRVLVATTLSSSFAIAIVLLLRRGLRARCGAGVAYAAWLLVPIALASVLLPRGDGEASGAVNAAVVVVAPIRAIANTSGSVGASHGLAVVACWGVGLLLAAVWLAFQQRRFVRRLGSLRRRGDGAWQADAVEGLPAAVGFLRPSVVVPADFDRRYTPAQRALMLAHERAHIVHGDLQVNACMAVLRCVFWFNPLVHIAARALRQDQELACDARVIAQRPAARRRYCEAMVESGLAGTASPLGCHWGLHHPLTERIAMLTRPAPSRAQRRFGIAIVVAASMLTGAAVWAAQPAITPPTPPTPTPPPAAPMQVAATTALLPLPALAPMPALPAVLPAPPHAPAPPAPPQAAQLAKPVYPVQARNAGISGKVVLQIDVAPNGEPAHVAVASADPAGVFDQAALDVARSWRFAPKLEAGRAVAYRVRVPVKFEAGRTSAPASRTP
jgi:TonB family protein